MQEVSWRCTRELENNMPKLAVGNEPSGLSWASYNFGIFEKLCGEYQNDSFSVILTANDFQ